MKYLKAMITQVIIENSSTDEVSGSTAKELLVFVKAFIDISKEDEAEAIKILEGIKEFVDF